MFTHEHIQVSCGPLDLPVSENMEHGRLFWMQKKKCLTSASRTSGMGRFRKANLSDGNAWRDSSYSLHISYKYLFRNSLCEQRCVPAPLWVSTLSPQAWGCYCLKATTLNVTFGKRLRGSGRVTNSSARNTFNSLALSRFHTVVDYGSLSNKD